MKIITYVILLTLNLYAFGTIPDSDKILKEGQLLYRLEKASWNGTDDFLARFPEKLDSIGGYLSYETQQNIIITIFLKRSDPYKILARYHFDSLPKQIPLLIDTLNIYATDIERDLITIRLDAVDRISNNADKFFTFYKNTRLNPIPLITSQERKVFVLTGPQTSGLVLIGNDYLLSYDNNNRFNNKKKIHNSLIQLEYKSDSKDNPVITTMHSHVISELIDPTDICTLLLYKDFLEWKKHIVISEKFVSIFDMEKEDLLILTKEAWDRINGDQEKK